MTRIRIFCDRCGKGLNKPKRNQIRVLDFSKSNEFIAKDLCDSCTRGLWNHMAKKILSYNDISKEDF